MIDRNPWPASSESAGDDRNGAMNPVCEGITADVCQPPATTLLSEAPIPCTVMTAAKPSLNRPVPERVRSAAMGVAMPIREPSERERLMVRQMDVPRVFLAVFSFGPFGTKAHKHHRGLKGNQARHV